MIHVHHRVFAAHGRELGASDDQVSAVIVAPASGHLSEGELASGIDAHLSGEPAVRFCPERHD